MPVFLKIGFTHLPITMHHSLDGCLPESTTVQDGIEIMWPEVGIATTATMDCPCGVVSYIIVTI